MEKEIDDLSFEDLLSLHQTAVCYYNSWSKSQMALESSTPNNEGSEESNLELFRRMSIDLNMNRRDNNKLKEEIKKLAKEKKKVRFFPLFHISDLLMS